MNYRPSKELDSNEWGNTENKVSMFEESLKDLIRMDTYKQIISRNSFLFSNKVVLEVGCGIGILSMFAAQAGAKRVYGIDTSTEVASSLFAHPKLIFLEGVIDEVSIPEPVDIILSDWMGHFLICNSLLESVIYARDKWLKIDGLLFPDTARIMATAIEDAGGKYERVEFWSDIYGIDMTALREEALKEAHVEVFEGGTYISSVCPIFELNLHTATKKDLNFVSSYKLYINKTDTLHGLLTWFEIGFNHLHVPRVLSTSPKNTETYWKQVLFYMNRPLPVNVGEVLSGSIAARVDKSGVDVKISFHLDGEFNIHTCQYYRIR